MKYLIYKFEFFLAKQLKLSHSFLANDAIFEIQKTKNSCNFVTTRTKKKKSYVGVDLSVL